MNSYVIPTKIYINSKQIITFLSDSFWYLKANILKSNDLKKKRKHNCLLGSWLKSEEAMNKKN